MFSFYLASLLFVLAVVKFVRDAYKKPYNFPPGPPSLPVYGAYWLCLATDWNYLPSAVTKLSNFYKTKVLGMFLGSIPVVVLNHHSLVKEFLNRQDLDGRMDTLLGRLRGYYKKLGIFFTDGEFWHVQRRFSLRYMRDFGFGRRSDALESVTQNDVKEIIDMSINGPKYAFEKVGVVLVYHPNTALAPSAPSYCACARATDVSIELAKLGEYTEWQLPRHYTFQEFVNGDLISLPFYFAPPFINGMVAVFTQSSLDRSDYDAFYKLAKGGLLFQRSSDDFGRALVLTPWLKDFAPNMSGFNGLRKGNQAFLDFWTNLITQSMETMQEESHDRHFFDMYLRKMKEEISQVGSSSFSVDQLALICTDYTFPPASCNPQVMTMLVEQMLLHPHIQDNVHEEIDRVVGRDRPINLDDRQNMPYTESCLREMMRFETLVPLGLPHRALTDTKFAGYDIMEGCMVAANYLSLHMSEEVWGDPHNFRPERFMEDGKLVLSKDKSLPFGAGKRLCAGETYARQTLFQVFAGFMQAFRVSTADGKPLKKPYRRIPGIITTLPEFWVKVTPRTRESRI